MSTVGGSLGEKIEEIRVQCREMIPGPESDVAIKMLEEVWELLPGEKYEYDESFHIVAYILEAAIDTDNKECLLKWKDRVLLASPSRYDSGEREMWVGRANFVLGDLEGAREYMKIANEKSRGRCFRPWDKVYKNFFFNLE